MEKLQAQDILINIFIRLPVKSLLRFSSTYSLAYDPSSSTLSNCVRINYPYKKIVGITFWGTCNGFICISPGGEDVVVLWNPATMEYKEVPIEYPDDEFCYVHHGFGTYNDEIDDFKIVRFEGVDDEYFCEVKVYTLKSNSWRRLENIPYQLSRGDMDMAQVIINGAMHFLADTDSKGNRLVIVSFDFKDEKFDEMPLPSFCKDYETSLCSLGDSLCLVGSMFNESHVVVWEMKTYGVTESWAELFTIDHETIGDYFNQLFPLQVVKNGKILLGYDDGEVGFHLDLYDIQRGTSTNLKTHADQHNSFAASTFVYVESLVMLNSGTYVGPPEIDSEEGSEENDDDVGREAEIDDFRDWEGDFEENDDDFIDEEDFNDLY
ncbi:F-box/kelch-repeat protein At3g06240-like isoform X1 [Papaver somniferum]|uniref:F-box/kelch-repeat protein At3g06240-like isoform X1 n=1 Tax=Papaver somniferum TaxID=3469 RepID=UPI000E702FED|nr:F-box/kelch-repeat protein At3g06240-like isoform X1 [Papaver somniferum]